MHLFILIIAIFFVTGEVSKSSQTKKLNTFSLSIDTILFLKKQSQTLLIEKKYDEVYWIFSRLADFYHAESNTRMYFDYKNKASNCFSKFADPGASLDTAFQLFKKYDISNLNDTTLAGSIINNIISNYNNLQNYPVKLNYIDFLIDSTKSRIIRTDLIQLAKHRIEITNKLSILNEEIKSYYDLLKQKLSQKDEIRFEIDLGNLFYNIKEYQLSNITLQNTLCNKNVTELDKAIIYNILGNNYLYLEKHALSHYFYKKSLLLREKLQNNSEYLRVIYNNLANYYTSIGKMDSARILYRTSLIISNQEFGNNSIETAFDLNNLGNHYYNLEKYDSAFIFYQQSYRIKQSIKNYKDIDIIHSLYNLGLTRLKLGDISNAILLLQKSVNKNFEIAKTYSLKDGLSSPNDYIFSCKNLGDIYYNLYINNQNISYLDSAKTFFKRAISTNDSIIYSTPIESSKIFINLANRAILENYLQCFLLEDPLGNYSIIDTLQTLSLFDKCHNYVLLNKLIEKDENPQSIFNLALNNDDKSLDQTYNTIELLEDEPISNINEICELSRMLFNKIKNAPHRDKDYYRQYNWKNEEVSSTRFMQFIEPNTIILEYTSIKGFLFCMSVTCSAMSITGLGKVEELQNIIEECSRNLRQFTLDFNQLYNLSNILLSPLKKNLSSINKIIIINDEDLLKIPFDALLLTEPKNNPQDNTYLIKNYDISYCYSINLMLRNSSNFQNDENFDFIGFAPKFFENSDTNDAEPLTGSNKELVNISELFEKNNYKSLSLYGFEANIENFYDFAGKTNILHIATHSPINDNSPNGGFLLNSNRSKSNNLINYYDVLNLKNSPTLVVLASCSSNSGKIIEGEGVQNIGRAFSIKGSSFIISSLFRLDDEFSYKFMSVFYNKFLASKNIINSLCESKREFIYDKTYSYPTYWSNFNLIGK